MNKKQKKLHGYQLYCIGEGKWDLQKDSKGKWYKYATIYTRAYFGSEVDWENELKSGGYQPPSGQ